MSDRAAARALCTCLWVSGALVCAALACQPVAPSAADNDAGASDPSSAGMGAMSAQGGSSGAGTGGASGGGSASDERCEFEPVAKPDQVQVFSSFRASLVEAGKPAVIQTVQVCGFDLCLNGDPVSDGEVEIASTKPKNMLGPAFKVGDGRTHPILAFRLENEQDVQAGVIEVLSFPDFEGQDALESGHTAQSQGVSLSLGKGTTTKVDLLAYPTDKERKFRALVSGPIVHPAFEGADAIVSLAPEGTHVCPPATLEMPNLAEWPPGTKVELLLHGVHLEQEFAPYGGLAEHGVGAVDETGDRLVFPDSVRLLGTFALRRIE